MHDQIVGENSTPTLLRLRIILRLLTSSVLTISIDLTKISPQKIM